MPASKPFTRSDVIEFSSLDEAKFYAMDYRIAIWAKVHSFVGVFHVYPGGRVIYYRELSI